MIRCIYAYFAKDNIKETEIPMIDIPENTVIKLKPDVYFCNEIRYFFKITIKL